MKLTSLLKEQPSPDENNLIDILKENNISYLVDEREKMSPGYKFNEWEMKGVPIRVEIGPRDVDSNKVVMVRRDSEDKEFLSKDGLFFLISFKAL